MVEIPEEDRRHRDLGQGGHVALLTLALETVLPGRLQDIGGLRAIARDTTLDAHLLERHETPVVGKNGGQCGGSALGILHLQNGRRAPATTRSFGRCLGLHVRCHLFQGQRDLAIPRPPSRRLRRQDTPSRRRAPTTFDSLPPRGRGREPVKLGCCPSWSRGRHHETPATANAGRIQCDDLFA